MMKVYKWGLGATALALVLAACDDSGTIKFPGFSTPDEETTAPPPADEGGIPAGQPDPEVPVDSVPDAIEPPPEDADPADTDSPGSSATDTPDTEDTVSEADAGTDDTSDVSDSTDSPAIDTPDTDTPDVEPEPPAIVGPTFSYMAPGILIAGSGTGSREGTVFSPGMVFPIKDAPAYPQSMVWGYGGFMGEGGGECDPRNYQYPWHDNFCETRSRNFNSPYCPVSKVHLGQDIRVGTPQGCQEMRQTLSNDRSKVTLYKVVAAEDGVISNIGSYTVNIRAGSRIYRYMHMNMRALQISLGDTVTAGQTLGYVSKDFGGNATTFHLHFEIKQNTAEQPWAYVPPYTSLVAAYERREGGPGEKIEPNVVGIASAPRPIPEGFIITE